MNLEFGLELPDPALGSEHLFSIAACEPCFFALVDPILSAPDVDRMLAYPEIPDHVSNRAT